MKSTIPLARSSVERTLQKRKDEKARKRRMDGLKGAIKSLEKRLEHQCDLLSESKMKVNLYKRNSRSYWELWQWELQQRCQSVTS